MTTARDENVGYDRCLDEGRRAYLAGLGKDECPYPRESKEWEFWREGYDH